MSVLMDSVLGRLGSRFCLHFQPAKKQLWTSPLGRLFDRPIRLEVSLRTGNTRQVWPFSPGVSMGHWEQHMTMTSLCFRTESELLGSEVAIRFVAPFYPQDEAISTAPFFYVDLFCRLLADRNLQQGSEFNISLFSRDGDVVERKESGIVIAGEYCISDEVSEADIDDFSRKPLSGSMALVPIRGKLTLKETTFSLSRANEEDPGTRATFILAAHCDSPVLNVSDAFHRFRYLSRFPDIRDVVAFAKEEEAHIRERCDAFDNLFLDCSLGQHEKNFIAYSFQSHLASTWWTESVSDGGADWFGCWDNQAFHNAMESEYVSSLMYLNLWPDLLQKQLNQRSTMERHLEYLPAACGRFLSVSTSDATGAGLDDTCDYLLLLYALWRWWEQFDPIERNASMIGSLADVIMQSVISENNQGEDSEASDRHLQLKILCALEATGIMASEIGDGDLADACEDAVRDLGDALVQRVQSSRQTVLESMPSPGRHNPASFDACPPLRMDGLLIHLMCDSLPELDLEAMACHYPHRNDRIQCCPSNIPANRRDSKTSVSHEVWLDILAAYLGIDFIRLAQWYWERQTRDNAGVDGGGYIDSTRTEGIVCDPRGGCSVALLQAMLGLKLDRVEASVFVSPLSIPARAPILALADWETIRVPWVNFLAEGDQIRATVEHEEMIQEAGEFIVDPHSTLRWGGS